MTDKTDDDAPRVVGEFSRNLDARDLALSVLEMASAIALVIVVILEPDGSAHLLARIGGVLLAGGAGLSVVGLLMGHDRPKARIGIGVAAIAVGVWIALGGIELVPLPDALLEPVLVVALIAVAATGLLRAAIRFGIVGLGCRKADEPRWLLLRWIDSHGRPQDDLDAIRVKLFFEGSDAPTRIGRFALMMLFASVISAAGVVADSTAVVIGAMLIAPLITPMMGMGLSLVSGWPTRLGRSTLLMLLGLVIATGTGWLLAAAVDFSIDLEANSQITSRSSPTAIDLVIAVAAGAAGAYALSRDDVSSSLPGVAVSIALVPPLSVVGITAQGGDWGQTAGTLVLFITNLVAIVVAGGVVFVLTGVVHRHQAAQNRRRVRTAGIAIAVLALVTVGVLVINGRQIAQDALDRARARSVVVDWLGDDSEFSIVSVSIENGDAAVQLAGPDDPPDVQTLAELLSVRFDREVDVDLQWIPRRRITSSSAD